MIADAMAPQLDDSLDFKAQKERIYNKHLPYYDQLQAEAVHHLQKIKENISRSVLLSEHRSLVWIQELRIYIGLYGSYFTKDDHIFFIKILMEIVTMRDIPLADVMKYAEVLTLLLKKQELLCPEDLSIEWRPLYDLYHRTMFSSKERYGLVVIPDLFENSLKALIRSARTYFPITATQEILEECRPLLCCYNNPVMSKTTTILSLFLPTLMKPENHGQGFKLWFDELLKFWQTNQHTPPWEQNLISLFSRLARDNIGYIDWDPWIPKIFTHLIRSFGLLGSGKKVQMKTSYEIFDIVVASSWLVSMIGGPSSICLDHIAKLFKAIESYYHPSNIGVWNTKLSLLLSKLPLQMVKRVHFERYKKKSWIPGIPESYKLKDGEITQFVNILKPIALISMFSPVGTGHAACAFQNLSALRPELVIPPLIERLYSAMETVTEPHRLTATMQCAIFVARNMVSSREHYPDGQTHVIPLLFLALPGIDPNDMKKCLAAFQFIATFITLVPVVDCSSLVDTRQDLTEAEYRACLSTSQWEDFVLQFIDRCIALIENSSLESPSERHDNESIRLNAEENITDVGLTSTFQSILSQCSPAIFDSALNKLQSYVSTRIFEAKVSGKMIANMCRAFVKVDPEKALKKFLPHFSKLVFALTETEDNIREHHLDEQLLFSLVMISETVRCKGSVLLEFKQLLVDVLRRSLQLKKRDGYTHGGVILRNVLKCLTNVYSTDYRSFPQPLEELCDLTKTMPLRAWGAPGDIRNLNVRWHVPSEEEVAFATELVNEFLGAELHRLTEWTQDKEQLTREELNKSLTVVFSILIGATAALPPWEAEAVLLDRTNVSLNRTRRLNIGSPPITLKNGVNVREAVALCLRKVLSHIHITCEDDTKSLNITIQIINTLLFSWGVLKRDFDKHWKSFHVVKEALENKLVGQKRHERVMLIDRVVLQHELRVYHASLITLTDLHCQLLEDLIALSTSHYSVVRSKAQEIVSTFLRHYPYSYVLVAPKIAKILDGKDGLTHEEFKGALYLLLGKRRQSLLTIGDWSTKKDLWLSLVSAKYSEKESIINLLAKITEYVNKYLETVGINRSMSKSSKEVALKAWCTGVPLKSNIPTEDEICEGESLCREKSKRNTNAYVELVEMLSKHIGEGNLHWRYKQLAFSLLCRIISLDVKFPAQGVQIIVNNLINESIAVRKMCISALGSLLEQQKRPHPKRKLLPETLNLQGNQWLQYDTDADYSDEKVWRKTVFVEKSFHGFYCWPKDGVDIYLDESKQPNVHRSLKELPEEEQPIYQFFTDQDNVENLFAFLSLEERKGHDKFNARRFYLFKGLYRNFGPSVNVFIKPKLESFTGHHQESFQRCAAEVIAGLVRACKHWPYKDVMDLKQFLVPLLKVMLTKMTPETVADWGTCCATSFAGRDPRKLSWFVDLFLEDPLNIGSPSSPNDVSPSFLQSSRLYCLLGIIGQQQWRTLKILQSLLNYCLKQNHLTHTYQNVREKLGLLLSNIFLYDADVPCQPHTLDFAPRRKDLFSQILPKLEILQCANENPELTEKTQSMNGVVDVTPERKEAMNLLKTLCHSITSNCAKAPFAAPPEFFSLLPTLCEMQSEVKDDALLRQTLVVIIVLSYALMSPSGASHAIESCQKVIASKSWHARAALSTFLQYMASSNLFTIMNNKDLTAKVVELVLKLVEDERLEVREDGAETLGGLVHCEFVQISDEFIETFRNKCSRKIRKTKNLSTFTTTYNMTDLVARHAGVLGLGAIVKAYPYDVPHFLPEILMTLANHLHDPQPVAATVKKTFSDFRRTHHDNWRDHKLKFSDDQLAVITDLLISPSYYA